MAIREVAAIILTIGNDERVSKKLTATDAIVPIPIWIAPINADALPAFLENGANDNADVLGLAIPKQLRNMNNRTIV